MSSTPTAGSKVAKVAGGALGGALGAGLVSLVPGVPVAATALTFVAVFGVGIYDALKDMF